MEILGLLYTRFMLLSNVFGDSGGPFRSDHPSTEKVESRQIGVPPYCRKELRAPPVASLSHRLHDDHGELYARGAELTRSAGS